MKIKLYDVGPKLTLEQVVKIEKTIGHQLPQQYKDFILQFNGGGTSPNWFKINYNGQEWANDDEQAILSSFCSIPQHKYYGFLDNYEIYKDRVPIDTIIIAVDQGRSKILLGVEGENIGKVFYWNGEYCATPDEEEEEGYQADYRNVGFIANSFNEFLKSLFHGDDDDNEYEADGEYEID